MTVVTAKSNEFPVNSLAASKIREFWAEFNDFQTNLKILPVIVPVLCISERLGPPDQRKEAGISDSSIMEGIRTPLSSRLAQLASRSEWQKRLNGSSAPPKFRDHRAY